MKRIKLFEDYVNTSVATNKFYLVIDEYDKLLLNKNFLKEGKIFGLEGISSSKDISNTLGTGCEILIEMSKESVLKENKINKVQYENINYLCGNNFKNLIRIMGKRFSMYSKKAFIEAMFKVYDVQGDLNIIKDNNEEFYDFLTNHISSILTENIPNINSFNDFCLFITNNTNFDNKTIYSILHDYILSLVEKYKEEEEWIVEGNYFKIPDGSTINIYFDNIYDSVNEENYKKVRNQILKITKSLFNYNILIFEPNPIS